VGGWKKSADVDERGCGGLAGKVRSRYRAEGWGRYGEVMSRSGTLRIVQNAARTTDVKSAVSWFVEKEGNYL
jgi:hypothetical protein